jgi:hypothetical protein
MTFGSARSVPSFLVLRPRDPEHARGLEVGLELRERIVELRPVLRFRVSLGSEARQLEFMRS